MRRLSASLARARTINALPALRSRAPTHIARQLTLRPQKVTDVEWATRQRHKFVRVMRELCRGCDASAVPETLVVRQHDARHDLRDTGCRCPLLAFAHSYNGTFGVPLRWQMLAEIGSHVDTRCHETLMAMNRFRIEYVCELVYRVVHPNDHAFNATFDFATKEPNRLYFVTALTKVEGSTSLRSDIDVTVWGERRLLSSVYARIAAVHALFVGRRMDEHTSLIAMFDANVYVGNFELGRGDLRNMGPGRMIDEIDLGPPRGVASLIHNVPDATSNAYACLRLVHTDFMQQAVRDAALLAIGNLPTKLDDQVSLFSRRTVRKLPDGRRWRNVVRETATEYRDAVSRIAAASIDRFFTCSAYKHVVIEMSLASLHCHDSLASNNRHVTCRPPLLTVHEYLESAYENLGFLAEYTTDHNKSDVCTSREMIEWKCVKFIYRIMDALERRAILRHITHTDVSNICFAAHNLETMRRAGDTSTHSPTSAQWWTRVFPHSTTVSGDGPVNRAYFRALVQHYLDKFAPLPYLVHVHGHRATYATPTPRTTLRHSSTSRVETQGSTTFASRTFTHGVATNATGTLISRQTRRVLQPVYG